MVSTIGNVPDIMKAISDDKTGELAALYDSFDNAQSITDKRYYLKKILYFVIDVADVPVNSRGGNIDLTSTSLLLDDILSEGRISDANLRMLVNSVTVHQNEDKSLDIHFEMNGDFTNSTVIILEPMFEEMI